MKFTLCLDSNWAEDDNVMNSLRTLAREADYETKKGLGEYLSAVCFNLMRRSKEVRKGAFEYGSYGGSAARGSDRMSDEEALKKIEVLFNEKLVDERIKFGKEEQVTSDSVEPGNSGTTPPLLLTLSNHTYFLSYSFTE